MTLMRSDAGLPIFFEQTLKPLCMAMRKEGSQDSMYLCTGLIENLESTPSRNASHRNRCFPNHIAATFSPFWSGCQLAPLYTKREWRRGSDRPDSVSSEAEGPPSRLTAICDRTVPTFVPQSW